MHEANVHFFKNSKQQWTLQLNTRLEAMVYFGSLSLVDFIANNGSESVEHFKVASYNLLLLLNRQDARSAITICLSGRPEQSGEENVLVKGVPSMQFIRTPIPSAFG